MYALLLRKALAFSACTEGVVGHRTGLADRGSKRKLLHGAVHLQLRRGILLLHISPPFDSKHYSIAFYGYEYYQEGNCSRHRLWDLRY